jgi:hypothetical protein
MSFSSPRRGNMRADRGLFSCGKEGDMMRKKNEVGTVRLNKSAVMSPYQNAKGTYSVGKGSRVRKQVR